MTALNSLLAMVCLSVLIIDDFNHNCDNVLLIQAHASCVFKGKIWVTGGKTDKYTAYNLLTSYQVADVWYSSSGGRNDNVYYS